MRETRVCYTTDICLLDGSGLEYEKYMMLNAAVPIEAYDPGGVTAESKFAQTPPDGGRIPIVFGRCTGTTSFPMAMLLGS